MYIHRFKSMSLICILYRTGIKIKRIYTCWYNIIYPIEMSLWCPFHHIYTYIIAIENEGSSIYEKVFY